jgi:hypothetical protein
MTRQRSSVAEHIEHVPLADTHEHLVTEAAWLEARPDVLGMLFGNYVIADLMVAGASQYAVDRLRDPNAGPLGDRFDAIEPAWEASRHTGYGEAVRLIAERVFGLEEISRPALEDAQTVAASLLRPGERGRLLRDVARLDHVQVDDFQWKCGADASDPCTVFTDLSWWTFATGKPEVEAIHADTGIEVRDLEALRRAIAAIFAANGPSAIAVKAQHAYDRTLWWEERTDGEAGRALQAVLGGSATEDQHLCLGDWCLARGIEEAIEYDLPVKLHTGYYTDAGTPMPVSRIHAGNLWSLLARYPKARFVLMHIAYPYDRELVAIAKHYPNVWVDLCWAWSIDPFSAADFVRRFVHAVPVSKLFAFGGDGAWPTSVVGYAAQARAWLTRALEAEVATGDLTDRAAIAVADRLMHENQHACFDLEGRRETIRRVIETSA